MTPTEPDSDLTMEQRVTALERRVDSLESARPGRKAKPMIAPNQPGVCGLDPSRDSKACSDASIYRHQKGCRGDACVLISREYYAGYRDEKRDRPEVVVDQEATNP